MIHISEVDSSRLSGPESPRAASRPMKIWTCRRRPRSGSSKRLPIPGWRAPDAPISPVKPAALAAPCAPGAARSPGNPGSPCGVPRRCPGLASPAPAFRTPRRRWRGRSVQWFMGQVMPHPGGRVIRQPRVAGLVAAQQKAAFPCFRQNHYIFLLCHVSHPSLLLCGKDDPVSKAVRRRDIARTCWNSGYLSPSRGCRCGRDMGRLAAVVRCDCTAAWRRIKGA